HQQGAASMVLLKPPAGSPEAKKYVASYFVNFEPMVKILGTDPEHSVTLDEHIEKIAGQLVDEARATKAFNFRVDGPYWAVLAALHAAVEVNGAVDWDLSQHQALNYVYFQPNSHVVTDDPLELSAIVISQLVRYVLVDEETEICNGILEMFKATSVRSSRVPTTTLQSLKLNDLEVPEIGEELPTVSII